MGKHRFSRRGRPRPVRSTLLECPMISRRTALALAQFYRGRFCGGGEDSDLTENCQLYDFLYERDYPSWFCTLAKQECLRGRGLQEWVMKLHTSESLRPVTKQGFTPDEARQLGQGYLVRLATDAINWFRDLEAFGPEKVGLALHHATLLKSLELDGYTYRDGRLHPPESDVLDTTEVAGVLEGLYTELGLGDQVTAQHCLKLSEDSWLGGRWDDCINNSRRFVECVLREVAAAHSLQQHGNPLPPKTHSKPELVRQYLRAEGLLDLKEEEAIRSVYGLLSNTGSHPYIAQKDQARLLRQQALLLSQFVMLRYQGFLNSKP
jgi:hypothetical protein